VNRGAPEPEDGALVRPFYLTRGRTRGNIALDALVSRSAAPGAHGLEVEGLEVEGLEVEHRRILELCAEPVAVAEVAGRLQLPLGVVRVLLDDLVDAGCLDVVIDRPLLDDALLERLIRGVERL
jgi:Protein of unknown function (DUF742)